VNIHPVFLFFENLMGKMTVKKSVILNSAIDFYWALVPEKWGVAHYRIRSACLKVIAMDLW